VEHPARHQLEPHRLLRLGWVKDVRRHSKHAPGNRLLFLVWGGRLATPAHFVARVAALPVPAVSPGVQVAVFVDARRVEIARRHRHQSWGLDSSVAVVVADSKPSAGGHDHAYFGWSIDSLKAAKKCASCCYIRLILIVKFNSRNMRTNLIDAVPWLPGSSLPETRPTPTEECHTTVDL
jgi:hypothetical protein